LRGLRKVFESLIAVDDFTLEVAEGEFVTLLGPSGCGKTTLLRMIAGFGRPTAGAILLDGVDITRLPPERRPFNMVFQTYALFPHMNVFDNVAYGLRTAKLNEDVVRERVLDGLKLVGLEAKATVGVRALSGGQQQRVALVRAIVNEPRVLLLDEPLGALDLKLRKRMQDELRAIQRRIQTTFIYVTHDQEEALVMSHRIVLMRDGRVVQVGAPADVYHRPQTRFVAEFVGEANLLPCLVVAHEPMAVRVKLERGGHVGTFPYFGTRRFRDGDPAMVAVRPEHLRLTEAGDAALVGRLAASVLTGPVTVHEVRLDDGSLVRVQATEGDAARVDNQVGVRFIAERGAVVAHEESAIEPEG
jgi:spermidine/putrescine transport system ATP-binding protein